MLLGLPFFGKFSAVFSAIVAKFNTFSGFRFGMAIDLEDRTRV
jgi:hypothetical protein